MRSSFWPFHLAKAESCSHNANKGVKDFNYDLWFEARTGQLVRQIWENLETRVHRPFSGLNQGWLTTNWQGVSRSFKLSRLGSWLRQMSCSCVKVEAGQPETNREVEEHAKISTYYQCQHMYREKAMLKTSVDGCQSTQSQPVLTLPRTKCSLGGIIVLSSCAQRSGVPDEGKNPIKLVAAKGQHRPNAKWINE